MKGLHTGLERPKLRLDSQPAVNWAGSDVYSPRTKHLNVDLLWLKLQVEQRVFEIFWESRKFNTADYFTHAVTSKTEYDQRTMELFLMVPGVGELSWLVGVPSGNGGEV